MPEETIISYCSPTLAGIKTANLFSLKVKSKQEGLDIARTLNKAIKAKGLCAIPLRYHKNAMQIYLYRPNKLQKDLSDPIAKKILMQKGYPCANMGKCICKLIQNITCSKTFPHEIGLFLGYPPSDVECFMNHSRTGVQCVGCWKAYSNKEAAENTFANYKNCTMQYKEAFKHGKTLAQLAVQVG